jgi:hypothetical protein
MAFCDGAVQMMNYGISKAIHGCLCNRKDGIVVDAKKQ